MDLVIGYYIYVAIIISGRQYILFPQVQEYKKPVNRNDLLINTDINKRISKKR